MADHTRTPWKHGSRGNGRFVVYGGEGVHGKAICVMRSTQVDPWDHPLNLEADANAAFIVRACNSYDELLAALHRINGYLCEMVSPEHADGHPGQENCLLCQALEVAYAAIAKAKGETPCGA